MEILQSKIYGKNDNFNLEEGKSYSSLKSSFIIKQINDKVGKIYITDSLGYCIKIFDIELNDEIKSLSKNLEEYKLKVSELLTDQKSSLTKLINDKSADVEGIKTTSNELKESVKDIKKKLPKKIIWEDSKIKIKLQDDNFIETEKINIVTENTKIKSFKYEAGVFKITDTNNTVFPSNVDLTQIFAPKIHNHDTEYVKLNDERLTNARIASDVHSWAKQPNKPVYNWGDIQNKPELNFIPISWNRINGKEIIKTNNNDGWLYLDFENSFANGLYSGNKILRTDGQLQVGNDGNVFRTHKEQNNDSIIIGNKIRIKTGTDDSYIAFGNTNWTKLAYGEFAGIRIWNNVDNNKVVLAGGDVKNISDFATPQNIKTAVNNILIGGRNLARGTGNFEMLDLSFYIQPNYAGNAGFVNETFRGNKVIKLIYNWQGFQCKTTFEKQPMIISFWAKTTKPNINIYYMINESRVTYSDGNTLISDGQWHRYTIYGSDGIVTSNSSKNGFLEFNCTSGKHIEEVYVSSFKIEYGNKPTDWSPAPEDLIAEKTWEKKQHSLYGESLVTSLPSVQREVYLDNNSNSKNNLWTANNELNVGSINGERYAKINCGGYKKINSTEDHFLLGNGEHEHRKFIGRSGEISSNWTILQNWYGQSINIITQCNVNLSPMENNFNISFRKCFAGGQVTFTTTGKIVIFTGDNQFNGGDGSTCVVSSTNNKLYIDIRNI